MLFSAVRTVIIYIAALAATRLMGKREIGNLSPFDLVIAVMIAELGAMPLQDNAIPLRNGLIPMAVLAILEIALALLAVKSVKVRRLLVGEPTIVIEDGRILDEKMRHLRYNINDLLTQLRDKNLSLIHIYVLFVGMMDMGTEGAAYATVIAQASSFFIAIIRLKRQRFIFDFRLKSFGICSDKLKTILKVGVPSAMQMVTVNVSYLLVTGMLNVYGVDIAAASGIGLKVNTFAGMPCWAIGQAVTAERGSR